MACKIRIVGAAAIGGIHAAALAMHSLAKVDAPVRNA